MSVNACVLGRERVEFCKSIAKLSSSEDFSMYSGNHQGKLLNLFEPTRYPEKIQALVNPLFLCDFVIFFIDEMTAEVGEQIVLLDLMNMPGCFVAELDISKFIKGTRLEGWPIMDKEQARILLTDTFQAAERKAGTVVFVDHSFDVKGVGSVLLGLVRSGSVKVHDTLRCFPGGKELDVKSMQKNDVDVHEALETDRLGMAFKKLKSEDVPRGSVLSKEQLKTVSEINFPIQFSKFSAKDVSSAHVFHCLQSSPCLVQGTAIKLEKEIAIVPGEPIILCDLNRKMRVIGKIMV